MSHAFPYRSRKASWNQKATGEGGSLISQEEDDDSRIAPFAEKVNGNRYHVEYMPIDQIKPSPENDGIYGKIDESDEAFNALWNAHLRARS